MKVIELFVYAILLIAAIIWVVGRGGVYAPNDTVRPPPASEAPGQSDEMQPIDMSIYILPPKGEFAP
jgi:hypothetical protein